MKNLGTLWRTIIAVGVFLLFGWISILIGTDNWQETFQAGMLGVIMIFVVYVNKEKS